MHRFTVLLILFSLGLFSLAGCTPDPGTEPTMDDTVAPADPHVTTDVLDDAAPELGDGAEEEHADEVEEPADDAEETEET